MAADHVEEREFVLRFTLEARFPPDYEGDLDGYAWYQEWTEELRPALLHTVFQELRRHPGWRIRVLNRGASADREVEIVVEPTLEPS